MDKALVLILTICGIITASQVTPFTDAICEGVPPNESVVFPHQNCSKYWLCNNGTATEEDCPPGLWFNPVVESCDWPENTDCIPVDPRCNGNETDYLPHPTDCSKYIECHNGGSYEMSCPPGLWFDVLSKQCKDADKAVCGNESPGTPTIPTTTPFPTEPVTNITTISIPTEPATNATTTPLPTEPVTNTTTTPLPTEPATNATTTPRPTDPTTTPTPTNATTITTTEGTTPPWNVDPACYGVPPGHTELRPYPGDCTKFYECTSYSSNVLTCPDGLYFNYAKQLCDYPALSGCDDSTTTTNPSMF